ncbi:hypothetical protein POM88_001223 [Heracleum sosnowskyi]|uniref:EGF-like calcium-binding domain-containing protein n=1 Tax=Heracleum sosnowskyi TaxID=360622 RepID=A0AAD8JD42_9APIA|nr:hypothetical protein POM88_001223 [Heracleum sosnowskyi]
MEKVPAVLEWRLTPSCHSFEGAPEISTSGSFCGRNTNCTGRELCSCLPGYQGNPYLQDGCQDIDECARPYSNRCEQNFIDTPGSYNCSCRYGYETFGNQCFTRSSTVKKAPIVLAIGTL